MYTIMGVNEEKADTLFFRDIPVWVIAAKIQVSFLILITGVVGNGFVLWFYGKNKKLTGQVYILALAVIDLVCCVFLLPQVPLNELGFFDDIHSWQTVEYILITTLQILASFGVQATIMALD